MGYIEAQMDLMQNSDNVSSPGGYAASFWMNRLFIEPFLLNKTIGGKPKRPLIALRYIYTLATFLPCSWLNFYDEKQNNPASISWKSILMKPYSYDLNIFFFVEEQKVFAHVVCVTTSKWKDFWVHF